MDRETAEQLLTQPESPTFEFKQAWFNLTHCDQNVRKYQPDELVKAVLASPFASARTVEEPVYLAISATDIIGL